MSDFTPTTTDVRDSYAVDYANPGTYADRARGFDRWFASEIEKAERALRVETPVEGGEMNRFDAERLEELTRSAADTLYNLGDGNGRDNDLTWEEAEKYARAIFQMLLARGFDG